MSRLPFDEPTKLVVIKKTRTVRMYVNKVSDKPHCFYKDPKDMTPEEQVEVLRYLEGTSKPKRTLSLPKNRPTKL